MNTTLVALLALAAAGTFGAQLSPPGPARGIATGLAASAMLVWIPAAMLIDWAIG